MRSGRILWRGSGQSANGRSHGGMHSAVCKNINCLPIRESCSSHGLRRSCVIEPLETSWSCLSPSGGGPSCQQQRPVITTYLVWKEGTTLTRRSYSCDIMCDSFIHQTNRAVNATAIFRRFQQMAKPNPASSKMGRQPAIAIPIDHHPIHVSM